jgi:hypothetical protein
MILIALSVADLGGGGYISPKIYNLIIVKVDISDPIYLNLLLFLRGAPPPTPECHPPPLEISISTTDYLPVVSNTKTIMSQIIRNISNTHE